MRKPILFFVILFLAASTASADITITDPYPGISWPNTPTDVIGANADFDIDKIVLSFAGGGLNAWIYTNYGNATSLEHRDYGSVPLNIGDLFFGFPDAGQPNLAYAVPLSTHGNVQGSDSGSFVAGNLYEIGGVTGPCAQTAGQVLGLGAGYVYRPDEAVWLGCGTSSTTAAATGTVTFTHDPNPKYYTIHVSIPVLPVGFWDQLADNGGELGVQFASATCANDIIRGSVLVPVPEPSTVLTLGTLLVLLAVFTVRRRTRQAFPERPRG